ncbi:MAR-binding filament-like protein 1 [Solanum lycopersicum]|uniref:MAR-binding filament-like protein 1 n=1 Tax=Solanum lycopersicum TaxID=4081 RepID=UPI0037483A12
MAAPLNLEEGQSSTRPPRFHEHFYIWWKFRMHDFLMAEDNKLWDIVLDGPFIPMIEENDGEKTSLVPKPRQNYDEADRKKIEKGYKAKTCESAKEIWDCLKTTHEGTEQVKESNIDMFTSRYENFKMKERETIHEMFTKLSSITNEMRSLGEPISMSKKVRKVLRILPKSWESKVDTITEAKHLKCGKVGHFIRECPLLKNENKEHPKPRSDKEKRRVPVLGKNDRKATANYLVKKALAAWGDSSSDSKDPDEPNDVSMVAVHEEETICNEMFAHMAHTKNEEEDDKVTLLDMKNDLNNYSLKKLRRMTKVMIDSVIELTSERDIMNAELDSLTENKVKLEERMSKMVSRESDNTDLEKQLNQITEEAEKLNGMSNGLRVEIEEKLKNSEKNLGLSLEKSNRLEKDIVKLKEELEKSHKWIKSSKLLSTATNKSNFNKKGLGSLNITPPFNPHSKYVFVFDNLLCLHCGKNGLLKGECHGWRNSHERLYNYAVRQNFSKERPGPPKPVSTDRFSKKKFVTAPMSFVSEMSNSQCWYMDSGCSKRMTCDIKNFLSLKTLQGGGVSFGDGKKGYILGVGKVGRSLEDTIDIVYHVNGLKYRLLSVSQICDKGN